MLAPTAENMRRLRGKQVVVIRKDGTRIAGRLVRAGKRYAIRPVRKGAHTKAFIPLVLFDLLAIEESPYGYAPYYSYPSPYYYGPYGGGYGGYPHIGYGPVYYD